MNNNQAQQPDYLNAILHYRPRYSNELNLCLIGKHGSGKSSLGNVIMEMLKPDQLDQPIRFPVQSELDVHGSYIFDSREINQQLQLYDVNGFEHQQSPEQCAKLLAPALEGRQAVGKLLGEEKKASSVAGRIDCFILVFKIPKMIQRDQNSVPYWSEEDEKAFSNLSLLAAQFREKGYPFRTVLTGADHLISPQSPFALERERHLKKLRSITADNQVVIVSSTVNANQYHGDLARLVFEALREGDEFRRRKRMENEGQPQPQPQPQPQGGGCVIL